MIFGIYVDGGYFLLNDCVFVLNLFWVVCRMCVVVFGKFDVCFDLVGIGYIDVFFRRLCLLDDFWDVCVGV